VASLIENPRPTLAVLYAMIGASVSMGGTINIVSIKEAGAMAHPNSFVGIFWAIPKKGSAAILWDHRCSLNDAEP
jgi:hypothetical protein